MSDVLFLDSGPLGLITQPQRGHEVIAITDWLKNCLVAGARVVVPAIVYYEIKRELLRANKTIGIARLDAFVNATPDRYVPLTDDALRFAAELCVVWLNYFTDFPLVHLRGFAVQNVWECFHAMGKAFAVIGTELLYLHDGHFRVSSLARMQ